MRLFTFLLISCACHLSYAQNQVPVISNFSASVSGGHVNISYDLSDAESNSCDVKLLISNNGGQTYLSKAGAITGDVGFSITPGTGKQITWNFDTVSNAYAYSLRLVADDRQLPDIQDIVDDVDSNRLRSDLEFVQGVRHYTANPVHLEEVKDTIEYRFNEVGLNTRRHDFTKAGYLGQNIIGRKAGLGKEDTTFIIDAHFDSVDDAPGADDNGSGVVGFLEALRVLAPYNFAKSIRFIGFDFEETVGIAGTEGSLRYTQTEIPSWEKIQGVANFEMIGYYSNKPNSQQVPTGFNQLFPTQYNALAADSFRGNFIVNVGDEESVDFNHAFDSLSGIYVPDLKITSLTLTFNGFFALDFRRSDHANFWDRNIPALLLTDGANFRNLDYHTPDDTLGALSFTFMSNVVKGTVATIATLAGIQHSSYSDFDLTPLSIPRGNLNCEVQLNPVPVKSTLSIMAGDCFEGNFTFRVMDIQGKEVLHKTMTGKYTEEVLIDKLAAGIYFAVLENTKGSVVRKFAKE
ncbi:MAG: M28 family peptidase [Bacteroidota bacterium]